VIRIVVPDFEEMISDFHKQTPVIQSNWEINANFPINTPTELFIARILYPDHKYLLNFEIIKSMLQSVGFVDIRKCKPGETKELNLATIFYLKEDQRIGDIIIEAIKPDNSVTSSR